MTTKEISVIEKTVSPVVAEASQLNITSTETLTAASILRERIKEVTAQVEEDKELLYRPIKDALDEVNNRYAPFEKPLKTALKIVNDKMSEYQTAEVARAKAKADAIASRVKEGKGYLKPETAMEKIANIETPAVLADTNFINRPKVQINDISAIPDEYFILDEKAVEKALKEGRVVPGATLVDNYEPRTR